MGDSHCKHGGLIDLRCEQCEDELRTRLAGRMKYAELALHEDARAISVRPEHVSYVLDHESGAGSVICFGNGDKFHVGGSRIQVDEALEMVGEDLQADLHPLAVFSRACLSPMANLRYGTCELCGKIGGVHKLRQHTVTDGRLVKRSDVVCLTWLCTPCLRKPMDFSER